MEKHMVFVAHLRFVVIAPRRLQEGCRWLQDGPKMAPRRRQDGPRLPQDGPKRVSGPLKRAQEGPKRFPRAFQGGPKRAPRADSEQTWLQDPSGIPPGPLRDPSGALPGAPRDPPGIPQGSSRYPLTIFQPSARVWAGGHPTHCRARSDTARWRNSAAAHWIWLPAFGGSFLLPFLCPNFWPPLMWRC